MLDRKAEANSRHRCKIAAALAICAVALLMVVSGCDRVTRHKVLTTLFDGVPSLPPADELYRGLPEKKDQEGVDDKSDQAAATDGGGSSHKPYAEKRCDDCHEFDASNRLVTSEKKLCYTCHDDFIQGEQIHGPVSVGDCLACHLPHNSKNSALLVARRASICMKCHRERRLAVKMHDKVTQRDMLCIDCHDPHFGDDHYFLN